MTKAERAKMYEDFLREEGYLPQIDNDGDVVFKMEGRTFLILIDPKDDEFLQVCLPNFWPIESEDERERAQVAANYATEQTKVAKVFPVADNMWATAELFCSPPEMFKPVFRRFLSAITTAVETFRDRMNATR